MEWFSTKTDLPKQRDKVLVTDGRGSFTVAMFSPSTDWDVETNLLYADDGGEDTYIYLDPNDLLFWSKIDTDSPLVKEKETV